jgi:hypothetical protein
MSSATKNHRIGMASKVTVQWGTAFVVYLAVGLGFVPEMGTAAHAAERIVTECPKTHPNAVDKTLRSAFMLHDGESGWEGASEDMVMVGDAEHRTEYHTEKSRRFDRAVLQCNYGAFRTGPELRILVPGILREYHFILRKTPQGSTSNVQWLRVWAVSETEDRPPPPK